MLLLVSFKESKDFEGNKIHNIIYAVSTSERIDVAYLFFKFKIWYLFKLNTAESDKHIFFKNYVKITKKCLINLYLKMIPLKKNFFWRML